MADYLGDFNGGSGAADDVKRRTDFDDLQRELSGVEVGRIPRFLSPEAREAIREAKSGGGSSSGSSLSALDLMLLNDPEYAQLYEGAMDALADAEQAAERALAAALLRADAAKEALDETLNSAMKLPDGTAVFMDAQGVVRDQEGNAIDAVLAASLEWQGNEPSYEEFVQHRDASAAANSVVGDIRLYQTDVLGDIRNRLTDDTSPVAKEDLPGLTDFLRQEAETLEQRHGFASHKEIRAEEAPENDTPPTLTDGSQPRFELPPIDLSN